MPATNKWFGEIGGKW